MALTGTLQNGLERYGIGPNVRDLRTRKRMGLVELCAHGSRRHCSRRSSEPDVPDAADAAAMNGRVVGMVTRRDVRHGAGR